MEVKASDAELFRAWEGWCHSRFRLLISHLQAQVLSVCRLRVVALVDLPPVVCSGCMLALAERASLYAGQGATLAQNGAQHDHILLLLLRPEEEAGMATRLSPSC